MSMLPNDLTAVVKTGIDGLVVTHVPWPVGEERIRFGLVKNYIPVGSLSVDVETGDQYWWNGKSWELWDGGEDVVNI